MNFSKTNSTPKTSMTEKMITVCKELLEQRYYNIIDEDETQILAEKPDGTNICMFMSQVSKLNTEKCQEYINIMHEMEINHAIIIYIDSITSSAKKIIENLPSLSMGGEVGIHIELFCQSELQYNITKHHLQPKFDLLTKEDAKKFKKDFGTKFPVMLKTDAIARFYGFSVGDVIKITRKNGYVTYRMVK